MFESSLHACALPAEDEEELDGGLAVKCARRGGASSIKGMWCSSAEFQKASSSPSFGVSATLLAYKGLFSFNQSRARRTLKGLYIYSLGTLSVSLRLRMKAISPIDGS